MTTCPSYLADYADSYASDPRGVATQWFRDAKFGLFMHYGLYSLVGRHEWLQCKEAIHVGDYAPLACDFRAERFDPEAIADMALDAGMKYLNITTRHHDGFCLWDTKQTTFNSVQAAPCGRDLVAELAAACEKRGLGLCLYYSHGRDWKHPHAPNNDQWGGAARPNYETPEPTYAVPPAHDLNYYLDFMSAQIDELLSNYGPIASIWLDGIGVPLHPKDEDGNAIEGFDPRTDGDVFKCAELYDLIWSKQPQVLISYKQGYLHTEDYFAPELPWIEKGMEIPNPDNKPWEVCGCLSGGWGYTAGTEHKSADDVMAMLEKFCGKGGNLLLNTGPLPDGTIDPRDAATLKEVGRRLRDSGMPGGGG